MSTQPADAEDAAATSPRHIGVIGVGTMGGPMARQLLAAGHELRVHDRSPAAVAPLVAAGAIEGGSAAAASDGADVVILSLPGPEHVIEAVAGTGGVLAAEQPPPYVIDLSTNSVETVRELRSRCADLGVAFIDAPVSGGVAKAKTGSLAVMVGASDDEFVAVLDVLECIGSDVMYVGPSGSGTVAKLVNNQLFLAAGVLVQEAYVLGEALGMAPTDLHRIISAASAGPYAKLAPLLLGRRFDDVIFRLDIATKDLALATSAAELAGVDAPLTRAAHELYEASVAAGHGEQVFHATLLELERRAGIELPKLTRPPRPGA